MSMIVEAMEPLPVTTKKSKKCQPLEKKGQNQWAKRLRDSSTVKI
jgi:hypothetical protein